MNVCMTYSSSPWNRGKSYTHQIKLKNWCSALIQFKLILDNQFGKRLKRNLQKQHTHYVMSDSFICPATCNGHRMLLKPRQKKLEQTSSRFCFQSHPDELTLKMIVNIQNMEMVELCASLAMFLLLWYYKQQRYIGYAGVKAHVSEICPYHFFKSTNGYLIVYDSVIGARDFEILPMLYHPNALWFAANRKQISWLFDVVENV